MTDSTTQLTGNSLGRFAVTLAPDELPASLLLVHGQDGQRPNVIHRRRSIAQWSASAPGLFADAAVESAIHC
ncbi:hypothetical protein [Nocardia sp. NPDC050406]|uniref:hypothetical protein n=1 Tax=Nocardia sp. NPDC050406 TaxID=3364318 RepID=UPI0037ABACF6